MTHDVAQTLKSLANRGATEMIGALQRTIAYASIAAGDTGYIAITAAAHGLKKGQTIYLATQGAGTEYIGTYAVYKVVSANVFWVAATFGVTRAGNITLTASLNGYGFIADGTLTIAEFVPESNLIDSAEVIARVYAAGDEVPIKFTKIRITAGNITVVRQQPKAVLDYTNR